MSFYFYIFHFSFPTFFVFNLVVVFVFEIGTIRRFPQAKVFKDNQELITCLVMVLRDFLTKSDNKLTQTTKFQAFLYTIYFFYICRLGIYLHPFSKSLPTTRTTLTNF